MKEGTKTRSEATPGSSGTHDLNPVIRYLSRFDDGEVVRWAFRGLLIGAIGVLALDLNELSNENAWWPTTAAVPVRQAEPILPAVRTSRPLPSRDPGRFVTTDEAKLGQPMTFELGAGGLLTAEGSIEPGTAMRFAVEIEARGEYVKTISLNSPGGALDDAMAMAKLVRERGLRTEVADGSLCASSCPLLLAGGMVRSAGRLAAVGVHQFYAAAPAISGPEQAMSDAQATTARISRHLAEMGVDPALWLHALDTPPQALYYFTLAELAKYRLVTERTATARSEP
jgi:hypothetical protein